jgi:hypothetical protein
LRPPPTEWDRRARAQEAPRTDVAETGIDQALGQDAHDQIAIGHHATQLVTIGH